MPPVPTRRTGRRPYNGFEVNLYGFLPGHLIEKDQAASSLGYFDFWDPGNGRLETIGSPGSTVYSTITSDSPREGTVAVFSGPQALADDGDGKLLDGSGVQRGTVNYITGRIQVNLATPAEYDVFVSYSTGPAVPYASHWDEDSQIWDRLVEQPVIQRTFWAIELDAVDLVNRTDDFRNLSYVDTVAEENAPFMFEEYGFGGQVADLDIELQRAWLRTLRSMWQLKNALRMWKRLLQNLGFTARVFPLYKTHPLNNYGENPGEIYSRVLDEITLEQQVLYETALAEAGFDPSLVPPPVTGATVVHTVGIGSASTIMGVQFPVVADPPDWSSVVLELYSLSTGLDPEVFTLNPATGEISGSLGALGAVDLFTGTGNIDFGRVLSTEYFMQATYTVIGAPYQAARVDLEIDTDESVPYKSGDRAADAVIRAIEAVRPIHILLRFLAIGVIEEEDAAISEGNCCGPNQAVLVEYTYPSVATAESAGGGPGDTVFGGAITNAPVVAGTFRVIDTISGQVIEDGGLGTLFGDGTGEINYQSGLWWAQFNNPVGAAPQASYDYFLTSQPATQEAVEYKADAFLIGERSFDRSHEEIGVTYADENLDSDYKMLAGDLVAGKNYAGTLHTNLIAGTVVLRDDTGQVITDDGAGNLVGDVDGAGTNTVNYVTGAYDVDYLNAPTNPIAIFQFTSASAHAPNQEDIFLTKEDEALLEGDYVDMSLLSTDEQEQVNGVATGWQTYNGQLSVADLVPGSVEFKEDPGAAQILADAPPVSTMIGDGLGTLNYATGALGVVFNQPTGAIPTVRYTYVDGSGFLVQAQVVLGAAGLLIYNVTLTGGQIVPGSVIVEDSGLGQEIEDAQIVSLTGNGSGTLNYSDGSYSLNFAAPVAQPVIAEYDRLVLSTF
jgi:hypothetical protein